MTDFVLNATLAADTMVLGDFALSRVLLMNDARYPWLILVPRRPDIEEIIDLSLTDQHMLMDEITAASTAVQATVRPDKINVAAIGNRVRQLHVHVLGRFESDPAWPGPVWGHSPAVAYQPHQAGVMADRMVAVLQTHGLRTA